MLITDIVGSKRKRIELSPEIFPGTEGSAEPLVSNSQRNGRAIRDPHCLGEGTHTIPKPQTKPTAPQLLPAPLLPWAEETAGCSFS